jgi:hypothetical protein
VGRGNGAKAETCNGGRAGVRTHLESAEDFGPQGGLVSESKHEDAGLDLFGREQVEPAGLLPKLHLRSGRGGGGDTGLGQLRTGRLQRASG